MHATRCACSEQPDLTHCPAGACAAGCLPWSMRTSTGTVNPRTGFPRISNLYRRSVEGLSIEFQMLNLLGFACYSAYNLALFCIPSVQAQYRHAYSSRIPVGLEDVAFAVHAMLITALTLTQCVLFERGGQRFFTPIGSTASAVGAAALLSFAIVGAAEHSGAGQLGGAWLTWLNLLLLLSTIKLVVSLVKYIPQV
jgi:cystinosin